MEILDGFMFGMGAIAGIFVGASLVILIAYGINMVVEQFK